MSLIDVLALNGDLEISSSIITALKKPTHDGDRWTLWLTAPVPGAVSAGGAWMLELRGEISANVIRDQMKDPDATESPEMSRQ